MQHDLHSDRVERVDVAILVYLRDPSEEELKHDANGVGKDEAGHGRPLIFDSRCEQVFGGKSR